MNVPTFLALIMVGTVAVWAFRRLRLSDVVGYVVGGLLATAILAGVGVDVRSDIAYLEPLRWLGLTLFSFTMGASIGLGEIYRKLNKVVATEIVVYAFLWAATGFLSASAGLSHVEKLAMFILLLNSSTISITSLVSLAKSGNPLPRDVVDMAVLQTNTEDFFQFVIFTILFFAGASTMETPLNTLAHIVTIAGLVLVLLYVSKHVFGFLTRTPFMSDRNNKFIIVIGIVLLASSITTLVGLPPLFGAFITGASISMFVSLDDISDMINGVKSLGLLLYFTSLGSQIYFELANGFDTGFLVLGLFLGVAAYALRFLALFISCLLTTGNIGNSFAVALNLGSLSEVGIVLIATLAERGLVRIRLTTLASLMVLSSMVLFSVVAPRLAPKAGEVEKLLPRRLAKFTGIVGRLYVERIDAVVTLLKPVTRFTAVALALSYINTLVLDTIVYFALPVELALPVSIATAALLVAVFVRTLKNLLDVFLEKAMSIGKELGSALVGALDLLIAAISLVLQLNIFYESAKTVIPKVALIYIVALSCIVSVVLSVYSVAKYYSKLEQPNALDENSTAL